MSAAWPPLTYASWSATCDTLHAHTQVLGKLAVVLAPPEPQLQHAALRLSARGWETLALPAPDGSGAIVAALDLHTDEAVVEHSAGHETRIALTPNRPVAEVTRSAGDVAGVVAVRILLADLAVLSVDNQLALFLLRQAVPFVDGLLLGVVRRPGLAGDLESPA